MIINLTISNVEHNEQSLLEEQKSKSFSSDKEYSIGRLHESGSNDWDLPDAENKISRKHATIFFKDDCFFIRDENSASGIWFCHSATDNEEKQIKGEQALIHGNILFIGFYEINVTIEECPIKPLPPVTPPPVTPPPVTPPPSSINTNFLPVFLEGLGLSLSTDEINSLTDNDIKLLGASFKEAIQGIIKLNRIRDKIKISLDMDDTIVSTNNILKKVNDVGLALKVLMTTPKDYKPLDSSIIEIHKNIDELMFVMKGLPVSSAKRIKKYLDPNKIEYYTKEQNNKTNLFRRKSEWDVYCEQYNKLNLYEEITIAYKEGVMNYGQKKQH